MAKTVTPTGQASASLNLTNTLGGDESGSPQISLSVTRTVKEGATAPEIEADGGARGTITATTTPTTIQLAHATDPLQGLGDAAPAQGYAPAGKKLRGILLVNKNASIVVDVKIPATNGLAGCGWAAGQFVCKLQPYGAFLITFPSGSSALTAGTNDGLEFTAASGTPEVDIIYILGD